MAVMRRLGGKPEATILGYPDKLSAPHAAFVNGALAHALNYDPIGSRVGHVGVACLPAPFAIAEAMGVVSGGQFLAAATVAAEVTARITAAAARHGRNLSNRILAGQLLSYFGAAAGAGRMLNLTAGQMRSAFGLALMQASGSMQVVFGGDPPAKAIYGAFPNHGAVLAVLLSQAGLHADCDALEGAAGLYETYFEGDYDPAVLTGALGTEYRLLATRFKPWPTSDALHPFIQAAMQIYRGGTAVSNIVEVKINGPPRLRPWCEPVEKRRRPENAAAAANSIPFCVAKTLSKGDVCLDDFTARGLSDEVALGIAGRTIFAEVEAPGGAARLEVWISGGRLLSTEVSATVDETLPPISYERLLGKFRDCCRYAATPLAAEDVRELISLIENLEHVENVADLAAIAGGQRKRVT
jgi:2-methylcitrate dehydratase PrpD